MGGLSLNTFIFIIELLASTLEGYIGMKFAELFLNNKYSKNKTNCIAGILSFFLAILVSIINSFKLFSFFTIIFGVIMISIISHFLYASTLLHTFLIVSIYFIFLNYIDFLAITTVGTLLQNPNYSKIVVSTLGFLRLRQLIICKFLLIIFYFLAKHFIKFKNENIIKHYILLTTLTGICIIYLIHCSMKKLNFHNFKIWITFSLLIAFGWLLNFMYDKIILEKSRIELMQNQNLILEQKYDKLNSIYSTNAHIYHDFNNHITLLHQYLLNNDLKNALTYLEAIGNPLREVIHRNWTDNETINTIICIKYQIIQKSNIRFTTNISIPNKNYIQPNDMCTILGNLIDNGIEACQRAQKDKNKWIHIAVCIVNAMIIIKIENGNEPYLKGAQLLTQKKDNLFHGWGLKSVKKTISKYEGSLQCIKKENSFRVVAIINFD